MIYRKITVPAGTRRLVEFSTTYSSDWSDADKRGDPIDPDDVSAATFLLKRHRSDTDEEAIVTKNLDDDILLVSGKLTVILNASDTDGLHGKYFGTLRLFLEDGGVVDWEDEDYNNVPYIILDFTQGAVQATE